MAWTTPRTWVNAETVTESLLNVHVRDNLNALMVVTTKGDIAVATAATTLARLAVGSDGALLVADSAATPGVRWSSTAKTAAAGAAIGILTSTTLTAAANSDGLYQVYGAGTFATGTYTGLTATGLRVNGATFSKTGTGTIDSAYSLYLTAPTIGTANWALFVEDGNSMLGSSTSKVFIGDTANANMTAGLTINQGTATNEILAFKNSGVAHGMTTVGETDTYYRVGALSLSGGAETRSFSEDVIGYYLTSFATNGDTAKTTSATANIILNASKKSGTSGGVHGADENLLVIINATTARFIFDAEGSAHADVEWIAFDSHDDTALLEALDAHASRDPLKAEFSKTLRYGRDELERQKIAHFDPLMPGHVMLNTTRLHMAEVGAIRQQADAQRRITQRLDDLEGRLNALSA